MNHVSIPKTARRFTALSTLAAVFLLGCSPKEKEAPTVQQAAPVKQAAAPVAPVPGEPAVEAPPTDDAREVELMQAVFGGDYRVDDKTALVYLPGDENDEATGYWRMSFSAARELPDGRTVIVVNGAPSDEEGVDQAGHGSSGMLNVYTLRRAEGAWQVLERHENAGMLGSHGSIGSVKWIDLGAGKPGILMSSGGTWQGYTVTVAEIFDLDRGMRKLGDFRDYSSNDGACGPETEKCWEVEGTISTVPAARPDEYRDIVVAFRGRYFRVTEDAKGNFVEHPTRSVSQTARYRFNGKEYVLVSGENPVPEA